MSAQDGGPYFPQYAETFPGASLRFELFKAAPIEPPGWFLSHETGETRYFAWRCYYADASLRALGLVGEEQDETANGDAAERRLQDARQQVSRLAEVAQRLHDRLLAVSGSADFKTAGLCEKARNILEGRAGEGQGETATAAAERAEQSRCEQCGLMPANCDCPPRGSEWEAESLLASIRDLCATRGRESGLFPVGWNPEDDPRDTINRGFDAAARLRVEQDTARSELATLRTQRDALAVALRDLAERAERARKILQRGTSDADWHMLDTEQARAAIAAIEPEKESTP